MMMMMMICATERWVHRTGNVLLTDILKNESCSNSVVGNSEPFEQLAYIVDWLINLRYPEYSEYVWGHVRNLNNSSLVCSLPIPKISWKPARNVLR